MVQPFQPTRRSTSRSPYAQLFGPSDENLTARCSIVVAHPGDEVVGAGCLISKLNDVSILHITDGAPPEVDLNGYKDLREYAEARRKECVAALEMAGVPSNRVVDLAVPFHAAAQQLPELTRHIARFLQTNRAEIVLTHPYEGGHPDHDATAFATYAALQLMREKGFFAPALFEIAIRPTHDGNGKVADFVPDDGKEITTLLLDQEAAELKRRMVDCLETHRASVIDSAVKSERFRRCTRYDFSEPPRSGKLHYEHFDNSLRRNEWRSLAQHALRELFTHSSRQVNASSQQNNRVRD